MDEAFNLHQLRLFVAVAEELHFRRAAERLHMSQPPLTRQIRSLEAALGVQLLERNSRTVALTPAGSALLRESRRVISAAEDAVNATRRAAREGVDSIVVGCVESAEANLLPAVLSMFCEAYPHISVEVRQLHTRQQEQALAARDIDCGILRPPTSDDSLTVSLLYTETIVAAVPAAFPWEQSTIPLSSLRDEDFVVHAEELGAGVSTALMQTCIAAGFVPRITRTALSTSMLLGIIAAGRGVSLLPAPFLLTTPFGVRFLPIADAAPVCGVALAVRKDDAPQPVLGDFYRLLRDGAQLIAAGANGRLSTATTPEVSDLAPPRGSSS